MKTNSTLKKLSDKSFTLTLTLPQADLQKEYQHVLSHLQQNFEQKGFRKGKAPLDVVEKNISPQLVLEEVLNHLLPATYRQAIEEHQLKPITEPAIKIKNEKLSLDTDWHLELTSCELPQIKFDSQFYLDIKQLNRQKLNSKEKTNKIVALIQKHTRLTLPSILLQNDVNRRLSELVDQLQKAQLNLEDYLKSKSLTLPQYRQTLEKQIEDDWTLNLAINHISLEQKIKVKDEDIQKVFEKSPELKNDPNLVYFLLTQQKVLEYLQNLA